jgi:hypothetical protein
MSNIPPLPRARIPRRAFVRPFFISFAIAEDKDPAAIVASLPELFSRPADSPLCGARELLKKPSLGSGQNRNPNPAQPSSFQFAGTRIAPGTRIASLIAAATHLARVFGATKSCDR